MRLFRPFAAALLATWMMLPAAQEPPGKGERGSIPPGTSRDQSKPSEGAIEGGSAARRKPGEPPIESERQLRREVTRCNELKGALREECLRDVDAAAGARRPQEPPSPATR